MNKIVFKLSIIDNKIALFWSFCFLVGTIISFYLSIIISTYFYFLTVPILLLTLYLIKLTITQVKDEYKHLIKKEKYLNDGRHVEYYFSKKRKPQQVKFELHIIDGQRHGTYKSYFENGQKRCDYNYESGKLNGEIKEYHVGGNLKLKTQYKNGEIGGVYKSYYENGQIEKNCNYINGKFDGLYKSYYEKGNLKYKTKYKEGIQYGETKSFYNNGNIFREFNLINSEYDGEIKEYFKNGNLKFLKENNKYTFYDKDYNLKCEIHSTGNDFIGTWKNYREDGTIEYELDFDDTNSDVKNNKVSKAIFTKGGDFYTKIIVSYKNISGSNMLYGSNSQKRRREGGRFNQPRIYMGPPDAGGAFIIDLKPISSIEDIIKLIPIKQSMDAPLVEAEDSNLYDVLRSVESSNPDRRLLHESLRTEIERDLENLTPREADVVRLYFGLGNQHPMSLEEIGETFDLTRERVRQIKEKAIRRIKHTTRSKILKTYLG